MAGRCWPSATTSWRSTRRSCSTRVCGRPRGTWEGFTDPLVDCRTCGQRFRADHLAELACGRKPSKHPGEAEERPHRGTRLQPHVRDHDRPREGLRGEGLPAPGDRAGHLHQLQERAAVLRKKPPFGIAQVGSPSQRDTPGNFIFRTREFEQMEMEFFVAPAEAQYWFEHWLRERERWYLELGIRPDHLRLRRTSRMSSPTTPRARATWNTCSPTPRRGALVGARGDRQPRRLRSLPPCRVLGPEARVLRPGQRRALRAHVIEPAAERTARRWHSWWTHTTRKWWSARERARARRARCCACIRAWRR